MNKENLLDILKSYLRLIERDAGEHPAVVLDDIKKSINHVLKTNDYKGKRAKWNENGRCSACDWYMPFDSAGNAFETLYCPHCGAEWRTKP